jgi:Do/DeqQ family serine protease
MLLLGVGLASGFALAGRPLVSANEDALERLAAPEGAAPLPVSPVPTDAADAAAAQPARRPLPAAGTDLPDFADVASRTVASVTNISVLQVTRTPANPFFEDPFFRQFFGGGGDDDVFGYRERQGTSAGSGVVVSAEGHVLTNNHVLGTNVRDVTVVLSDRRSRSAKVIGIDPITDLALLKIDGQGLKPMPWGDSSQLRVAEWVLAIGNPFSIGQTVTLGIVSALSRNNVNISAYEDFIQTDAAINPGNSGGALINRRGELIGINTAIFSQSGGYQGIGFAVPSNLARRVMDDLIKYGEVRRGSIGNVRTVAITAELARDLELAGTSGVLVWEMSRNSSAYESGLRPGDVIDRFNTETVSDPGQFFRLVSDSPVGSVATISVRRANRETQIKIPVQQASTAPRRRGA